MPVVGLAVRARRRYERQPQPASAVAMASMTPAAWTSWPSGSRSAMKANASSRPLASLTTPARLTTRVRFPVLACTVPSAAGPKLPNTLWPGARVPEKPATGIPVVAARSAACLPPATRTRPGRARRDGRRRPGERGGPADAQRDLPGQVLGDHVVALTEHPAHDRGQGGGVDAGDRGGTRRGRRGGNAAPHPDALGAQGRGKGRGRVGRGGKGTRAEVDRVVGVLRLAGRGQPPLVHLE